MVLVLFNFFCGLAAHNINNMLRAKALAAAVNSG